MMCFILLPVVITSRRVEETLDRFSFLMLLFNNKDNSSYDPTLPMIFVMFWLSTRNYINISHLKSCRIKKNLQQMYVDDFLLFLDCWVMSRCSDSYSPGTIRSSVLERKKKLFWDAEIPSIVTHFTFVLLIFLKLLLRALLLGRTLTLSTFNRT